ncbi:MAG: prephenate dehydrogenase/arogenate dehydrogenase family protein [Bacteriovoracaceae bacterium]|jgi:prephenate dehydrogenase|nr:prephenate dehydrogenase/arogenate dehydrogenase family protein [Bacteriovoracaceae bacterium]
MKVGLIGFGRLGRLISKYITQDSDLIIYDLNDVKKDVEALGARYGNLEEACQCQIVIPAVPISSFEVVIKEISPLIKKDALVIDVCSVKENPSKIMLEHLPSSVSILATHPMFGPDSARKTLFGSKIVLCPVRIEDKAYQDLKFYLEGHGMKVIVASPETHDKEISHSLLLTHFIGRTLMELGAKDLNIDTKGYRRLMKILGTVENDSWQLFQDMNSYNPYADETRKEFIEALLTIDKKVRS